ncbi:hypothetical protein CEXT_562791 [Caerostris extrusa]|uniref:Uncharacterized protein n=1 Tax=Caerostris extrusa TaxID=172846 RepID=A0AAV4QDD2_CAEEX|nr:hypothetical protein CEXT_562791 [Caerostris extrusa]
MKLPSKVIIIISFDCHPSSACSLTSLLFSSKFTRVSRDPQPKHYVMHRHLLAGLTKCADAADKDDIAYKDYRDHFARTYPPNTKRQLRVNVANP